MGAEKAQGEFGIVLISSNLITTRKNTSWKWWEEGSLSFVEGKEAGRKDTPFRISELLCTKCTI